MEQTNTIKTRNSSIELLKIIGLVLIVLSHSVPYYGDKELISFIDLSLATTNISQFILILFRNIGQIGNLIFVMCSAYFLLDKKKTNVKKILYIISDCFIISVLFLLVYLISGYNISITECIKQVFPITFENNWFVGCYIMLYIIHPFLNKIIESVKKETLLRINIFFIIAYCCIRMIYFKAYYYNQLIGFIVIYFIVAYNKLYLQNFTRNNKLNKKILLFNIFAFVGLLIVTNFLGLKIKFLSDTMLHWCSIMNIFGIMIGISLLNLFSTKNFENKIINYISSLSLLFYIIHENYLFKNYTKPLFYQYVFPLGYNYLLWVLIEAILLIIFGLVLSIIYKQTLQKLIYKIVDKMFDILYNIYYKVEKNLLKLT